MDKGNQYSLNSLNEACVSSLTKKLSEYCEVGEQHNAFCLTVMNENIHFCVALHWKRIEMIETACVHFIVVMW